MESFRYRRHSLWRRTTKRPTPHLGSNEFPISRCPDEASTWKFTPIHLYDRRAHISSLRGCCPQVCEGIPGRIMRLQQPWVLRARSRFIARNRKQTHRSVGFQEREPSLMSMKMLIYVKNYTRIMKITAITTKMMSLLSEEPIYVDSRQLGERTVHIRKLVISS